MFRIYCRALHASTDHSLCRDCGELEKYSLERLRKCPFGDAKPACINCRVHCYPKAMRERIRTVMRFAGPRMVLRHPALAVAHVFGKIKSS